MNNSKKILIFSLVYYPRFIGGAEIAIKEITDRISENDIQFDMIALRLNSGIPKYEKIGNVTIHRIGFTTSSNESSDSIRFLLTINKYLYPFLAFMKAIQLHKMSNYDGIWSMMASYNGFAALFFKLRFPKVPYLLTLQEGDPIEYIKKRTGILYPLFKKIFTKPDFIQTISNYLADYARNMGYKGEIKVIPNGVNVKHFSQHYSDREISNIKNELGKKEDTKYIITTSRLVIKNAIGDIIKALTYMPKNVELLVIGKGYQLEELRALADLKQVSTRVHFLGFISYDEMPKYVQISDVFVRPSLSEGFGNSFIEAMASSVPVVATPVGGIVDFLHDGKTGLFCEIKNPENIANKVKLLLENESLRNAIILEAKNMVVLNYDWNKVAKDMNTEVFRVFMSFEKLI